LYNSSAATLIPLIIKWIKPGTTIYTDCWKAYSGLKDAGYIHLTVNHSENFKDPETGTHTNGIESTWRASKTITTASGRRKAHLPGNLARYLFNKSCLVQGVDRTETFLRLAASIDYSRNRHQAEPDGEDEMTDANDDEDEME